MARYNHQRQEQHEFKGTCVLCQEYGVVHTQKSGMAIRQVYMLHLCAGCYEKYVDS